MTTEHDLVVGAGSSVSTVQQLYSSLNSLPQVTIAESGVTAGFNITSVEMEQAAGPSYRSRSLVMTSFTINITEPLGSNLIEAIVTSSASLGIQNFTKMWYYMDLTFQGYDENGDIDEAPLEDMNLDNGGRWVYPISITNIDMRLDESGAHYVITACPLNMVALDTTSLGSVPDMLNVSGGTISDFMNDFCKKLQASYKTRYLAEIYKFNVVIDPVDGTTLNPANFKLQQTDQDSIRNNSLDFVAGANVPTANISRGTTINDLVVFLYAHCDEAIQMMLDVNTSSALEDGSGSSGVTTGSGPDNSTATATFNNKQYRVPIVPIIEPEVSIFGYDPITGNYMKNVTFHIRSYRNFTANLTASQYGNIIKKNSNVVPTIINDLKQRNFLRKCYYYRFTGLNTEVIKIDPMNFNFSFQAVLPRISGWAQDVSSVSQHSKANPATLKMGGSLADEKNETSANPGPLSATQLAAAATTVAQQLNQDQGTIDSTVDQLKSQFGDPNDPNSYINAATTNNPATGKPYDANAVATYQKLINTLNSANADKATLQQSADLVRNQANQTAMLQRQKIEAGGATNSYAEDANAASTTFQMSYTQGNDEAAQAIGSGFTGQWHRGSALIGALMSQLYSDSVGVGLANISLEIRGDPYWLGSSALERIAIMNGAIRQSNSVLPDWTAGDTTFGFVMQFPNGIDSKTGQPKLKNDAVFNGMYRVTNVKSVFADGQFTQILTSVKLEMITAMNGTTGSNSGDSGGTTSSTNNTAPSA
ncbi:unnamed protein product [Sphagnum tenellum]